MNRTFKYIGDLPEGYEYKLFEVFGTVKVMGIAHDKSPIAFFVNDKNELEKIDLECFGGLQDISV